MATVTKARITARKGVLSTLPTLLPGELGLATDVQKVFMGMEPIQGAKRHMYTYRMAIRI